MGKFLNTYKRLNLLFLSLLLIAAVMLSGCSSDQSASVSEQSPGGENSVKGNEVKKATVIYHFKSGSLDPHNEWSPMIAGVVETLFRLDENLQIQPWLAAKWEKKNDRTWLFTIRDGVTFQDGTRLDAAAVKASFERGIAASKPLASALKIESMEASGQQLTVVTSEPLPALVSELVNPYAAVISVGAEKEMGTEAFNKAPVGTGPFKVKRFTPNAEVLLERYDDYWNGKAKLSEVSLKFNEDGNSRALALQSKDADIVYQLPAEMIEPIQKDPQLQVDSVTGLRLHYLVYNQQKPFLKDVKVRKALDLLVNRESIAQDIMMGNATPANGPFNNQLPFGSQDLIQPLNVAKAKKLLEEAGFQAGQDGMMSKDGKPLALELITFKARPELPLVSQLLQSDAVKAGIKLQIKMVENIDTYLVENNNWDLVTYSNLSAPRGDSGYFLNSALMPSGSLNVSNINIGRMNEIVNRLNGESDMDKRVQLTKDAVAVIKEEVPQSYLVYPNIIVGVNKRVSNWSQSAVEYYVIDNKMDVK